MRDEYDAGLWNDSHENTARGIDRMLGRIMDAFRVLHSIAWTAPWTATPKTCCDD